VEIRSHTCRAANDGIRPSDGKLISGRKEENRLRRGVGSRPGREGSGCLGEFLAPRTHVLVIQIAAVLFMGPSVVPGCGARHVGTGTAGRGACSV
jgi:hypothetical protein